MKKFKIKSFCKINLSLRVLKRLSNGYHNIKSLVTFCDLHDLISISKIKGVTDKITRSNAPSSVQVQRVPFSSQQQVWLEKAYSSLDVERAIQLNLELTNIYSYTGFEKEINEFIVDYWKRLDIDACYHAMDPTMGNAIAKLKGDGSGPTLLLVCDIVNFKKS